MAWNEPGNNNNKDPWGQRNQDGPPDLDEILKNLQKKLSGLFGGNGGGGSAKSGGTAGLGLIAFIALLVWGFSGIYIVDQSERGVVLQFGRHVDTTLAGPHWIPRFIQTVEKVNVSAVRSVKSQAQMLTQDENIVNLEYEIQYDIKDAPNYVFEVSDPDITLRQAAESAIREVVGKNTMDYIITSGREIIPSNTKTLLQDILDRYKTGIGITKVNLVKAKAPSAVQAAFDDATKAREDQERYVNEAEAYRNQILPEARGNAKQIVEAAKAYKVKVTKSAEGEADRFKKILREYRKAPKVTRDRLYLESIESVLTNSSKIIVDTKGGNNLLYLPLDKIMKSSEAHISIEPVRNSTSSQKRVPSSTRSNLRSREAR